MLIVTRGAHGSYPVSGRKGQHGSGGDVEIWDLLSQTNVSMRLCVKSLGQTDS